GFGVTTTGERVAPDEVGPADETAAADGETGGGEEAAAADGDAPAANPRSAEPPACGRIVPTTVSTRNAKTTAATTSRLDGDSSFTLVPPTGRGQPFGDVLRGALARCTVHA